MNLKKKTILLTGASSGIGKALAFEIAKECTNLILIARRVELLKEIAEDIRSDGQIVEIIGCDVSKKEEVETTYNHIKNKFKQIDIAILNAGVGARVTVNNYDSKHAENIFGANVFGIIYWIEKLLPDFLERKDGMIVGISSLADNRGFSGSGFYCASKAAASIYLEGLRVELKKYGVKVVTVKPGFVKTPMTDKNEFEMPLIMSPEKAARIIVKGIEKEKRIIQFPLPIVLSARLIGMLPGKLYEYLALKREK
jgi:short-subunit dehydrogenase